MAANYSHHMRVSKLHVYPVMSGRGEPVQKLTVGHLGPVGDRSFGVVDENGFLLSQKDHPEMASITATLMPHELVITDRQQGILKLFLHESRQSIEVKTTRYGNMPAEDAGDDAAVYLTQLFNAPRRLVVFRKRLHIEGENNGIFATRLPFHVITQESLDDLNARLPSSIPMYRFRPNLVISGAKAYEEDSWKKIKVGNIVLHAVKPTIRCSVTTVNQLTSDKSDEPIKTLRGYRLFEKGIAFGYYYRHENQGTISLKDSVEVLE